MISALPASVANTPMEHLREELQRLRSSPCTPVLLVGPPGAGKQHTAELLHQLSYEGVAAAPFVIVDCAAMPREFVDSELFGHERGAFADATSARRGLVELAHGGSLFLHEVSALPLAAQTMLLKFLDGMRLRRLGAQRELLLSLRVIASVSREPLELVESGLFHEDLYRRLAVFRVNVPDPSWGTPPPAGRFFQVDANGDGVPPPLDAVEKAYVRRVLEHTRGKRMAAASLLGISYPTFLKRLRELGLDSAESGVRRRRAP